MGRYSDIYQFENLTEELISLDLEYDRMIHYSISYWLSDYSKRVNNQIVGLGQLPTAFT